MTDQPADQPADQPPDQPPGPTPAEGTLGTMRATAHPVRLRILSLLTGAELSAADVARELDLTHANASYHLRFLAQAGLLEVAGEEKIRGGVAKRYRHPWQQARTHDDDVVGHVAAMAHELTRRYGAQKRRGVLVDAELWVTPDVFAEVRRLVWEASQLIHGQARPPRSESTVHVNLTAAAFAMDPAEAEPSGPAAPGEEALR